MASRIALPPNSSRTEPRSVGMPDSCGSVFCDIAQALVHARGFGSEKSVDDRPASRHRHRLVLILAVLVPLMSLTGCQSTRHAIEPYRSDPEAAATLEAHAQKACASRCPAGPPREFVTDGCSIFPDADWAHCCVRHDVAYWCGGSALERFAADQTLNACLADTGRPTLGKWMQNGVRVGGVPWLPTPWCWGYGWAWPTGYEPQASRVE
jgi:hypothetical protein